MNTEALQTRIPETDQSLIEAELGRLLADRKFAGAPQMSAFLRYIVNQTLQGNAERIKAYSVGVDALGKPDSFDAQNDPSVRVLALRLRKTLASIYESAAPSHAVVALRVGTYVPDFYKSSSELQKTTSEPEQSCRQSHGVPTVAESSFVMQDNIAGRSDVGSSPVADGEAQGKVASSMHSASTEISRENTVLESTNAITTSYVGKKRGVGKVLAFGVLVMTVGLWQFDGIRTVGAKPSNDTVLASMGGSVGTDDAYQFVPEPQLESTAPVLYFHSDAEQQSTLSLMGLLLSSRLVQAGSVRVINSPAAFSLDDTDAAVSYQLIVGEFLIEERTRLEVQIVKLNTGEVLDSSTLNFGQNNGEFSQEEIASVESLAMNISSWNGPLYQDYCRYLHTSDGERCGSSGLVKH